MPKAVWTGSLNLGLVNIPVSLYAATEPRDVRFHLVDDAGRRVHYRRFVEVSEAERDSSNLLPLGDSSVGSNGAGATARQTRSTEFVRSLASGWGE